MLLNLECLHVNLLTARWAHDREIARVVIRLEQDTGLTLLLLACILESASIQCSWSWIDTNQSEKRLQIKEIFLNGLILALRYLQRKPLLPRPLVNPQGLFYPTGEGPG